MFEGNLLPRSLPIQRLMIGLIEARHTFVKESIGLEDFAPRDSRAAQAFEFAHLRR